MMTKKSPQEVQYNKIINCAVREVPDFEALLYRFKRTYHGATLEL